MIGLGGCVVLLVGLFVLAGAGYPAPASSNPNLANPDVNPRDLAGEHVQTGGMVIDTEPVIIEIDDGTSRQQLPIENSPDADVGQEVIVDGTLTTDGTLRANSDRAVVRESWETSYMYAISVLGALFVALRIIDGWRFDLKTISFSPRDTPLHRSLSEDTPDG
jgi:hypothetical protein